MNMTADRLGFRPEGYDGAFPLKCNPGWLPFRMDNIGFPIRFG